MILAVVSDLLFESKIVGAARVGGIELRVARQLAGVQTALADDALAGMVIDLHLTSDNSMAICRETRRQRPDLPIVGFFSHVDTETKRAAKLAGATIVWPRSRFFADMPDLLRRMSRGELSVAPAELDAETAAPSHAAHPPQIDAGSDERQGRERL